MAALTAALAQTQLSRDLGDHFSSTLTSAGTTTTTTDTFLSNYDDDRFVGKFDTWVEIISGTDVGLSRRVTSKSSAVLTHIAFPSGADNGATYKVHRIATPAEKDDAITHVLNLLNGVIFFKKAQSDITIVADQFDYNIPSGFYRYQVRQVHQVSDGDTEITYELFDWEPRVDSGGGNDIHFFSRLQAGTTVRVFGHQVVAIGDLVDGEGESLILSARAAMFILTTLISQAPNEQIQRFQTMLGTAAALYQERLSRFSLTGIPFTVRVPGMSSGFKDRDFGIP